MEREFCRAQRDMYKRPNRWYLSAAAWTAQQFSQHHGVPLAPVLPSWVESIPRNGARRPRPVVLGDFRTFNKGSEVVAKLSAARPDLEFRDLRCNYEQRMGVYGAADAYLCLSLSEGGSFSVSDAEATALPLVTTDVGNYLEYTQSFVIPWQKRDDVELVLSELDRALARQRGPSFFEAWTFDKWRAAWRAKVEEVADVKQREPLL
jgi:glycosyltransferase involved in cell wall biosynthesis